MSRPRVFSPRTSPRRAQKRLIEGWLDSGVAAGVQAGMDPFTRTFDSGAALKRIRDFLARKGAKKG